MGVIFFPLGEPSLCELQGPSPEGTIDKVKSVIDFSELGVIVPSFLSPSQAADSSAGRSEQPPSKKVKLELRPATLEHSEGLKEGGKADETFRKTKPRLDADLLARAKPLSGNGTAVSYQPGTLIQSFAAKQQEWKLQREAAEKARIPKS